MLSTASHRTFPLSHPGTTMHDYQEPQEDEPRRPTGVGSSGLVSRHSFNRRNSASSAFTVMLFPDAPPNWIVAPLTVVVLVSTTWFTWSPTIESALASSTRNSATILPLTFKRTTF